MHGVGDFGGLGSLKCHDRFARSFAREQCSGLGGAHVARARSKSGRWSLPGWHERGHSRMESLNVGPRLGVRDGGVVGLGQVDEIHTLDLPEHRKSVDVEGHVFSPIL